MNGTQVAYETHRSEGIVGVLGVVYHLRSRTDVF